MSDNLFSALRWEELTPSDTVAIEPFPVAIFVGTAGDVEAKGDDGVSATFVAVAGQTLSIQPRYVMATGTTATNLVALYN